MLFVFVITSGSNSGWGPAKFIAPLIISILMFVGFFYYETRIPSSFAAMYVQIELTPNWNGRYWHYPHSPPSTWFLPNFSVLIGVAIPPTLWEIATLLLFCTLWKEVYHWSTTEIALRLHQQKGRHLISFYKCIYTPKMLMRAGNLTKVYAVMVVSA